MSRNDILVSVVIPTYSRNDALSRAVDCILAQTHQNLDVIVVDDNPADSPYRLAAQAIMEKYKEDSRVRYIQNPQNLGGSGARNVGIEASKGEYIAFLDDDDVYYPDKIEKQLEVFLNTKYENLALVYCDVEHIGIQERVDCVVRKHYRGNCLYEAIYDDCIASTSMWLVKKELINAVGNFSIVPCKQDSTVILKLLKAGYQVDYVPEVLCKYYNAVSSERISMGPKKVEGELLFYQACTETYSLMTAKQVKNIEFSFSKRLYILYSYRRDGVEKMEAERKKMLRLHPIEATLFLARRKAQIWKRKHRRN